MKNKCPENVIEKRPGLQVYLYQ